MVQALADAARRRWGHTEELLATIAEELDVVIRVLITANASKKPQFGPAYRYPRPSTVERKRKTVSPRDFAARLLAGR